MMSKLKKDLGILLKKLIKSAFLKNLNQQKRDCPKIDLEAASFLNELG